MGLAPAAQALGGFGVGIPLGDGQREENAALGTGADFKVGHALVIDFSGEQQLERIVADDGAVRKLHQRNPVIEDFKRGFLSFSIQEMAQDKDRLAFPLGAQFT